VIKALCVSAIKKLFFQSEIRVILFSDNVFSLPKLRREAYYFRRVRVIILNYFRFEKLYSGDSSASGFAVRQRFEAIRKCRRKIETLSRSPTERQEFKDESERLIFDYEMKMKVENR
jgi:hypothetical protein